MDQNTVKQLQEQMKEAVAGSRPMDEVAKAVQQEVQAVNLGKLYKEAISYLDDNFAFFLTHVLNMGTPEWSPVVPTAAVALPDDVNDPGQFRFVFHPTFAALLTPEEMAFVLGHETLHVLLNHLMLLRKGRDSGKFDKGQRFNIAADCVINDYLTNMGVDPGRLATMGAFGPAIVGYDCSNATVTQVYADVPEDQGDQGEDGEGQGGEGEGGGGQGEPDPLAEYMKGAGQGEGQGFDDHGWIEGASAADEKAAEDLGEKAKNDGQLPEEIEEKKADDEAASKHGNPGGGPGSEAGAMQRFIEQKGVSMKWAELLKEIDPDVFRKRGPKRKANWAKTSRKLAGVVGMYPDARLPVREKKQDPEGEQPAIVMFLDGSGSCAHHINTFIALAKSVPQDKIKLFPATFSTYVKDLDINEDNPLYASGGTAFGPIEQYIQTQIVPALGHYPKAVVVVTDGEGSFGNTTVPAEYAENWVWLLTDGSRYAYGSRPGKDLKYNDFAKGVQTDPKVNARPAPYR